MSGSSGGPAAAVSARRRREIINALRRGTVPVHGLDLFAVGTEQFAAALDSELDTVAGGGAGFKAVRGEYGAGKTFLTRWLAERALRRGFAAAEVQISERETPLHRLETVYRRVAETLRTAAYPASALRQVLDGWLFTLESDASASGQPDAVAELLERRLAAVSAHTPVFAQALRAYRAAVIDRDVATADGLAAWLGGQPQVGVAVRRAAKVKGELDHFGAMGFLQGLLAVLGDSGHTGLVLVLDEVETLQRVRTDMRDRALNALRQLVDEVDAGRFPGLYLVVTGTPAFFDGPNGVHRLPPLAQRLATDFDTDARFDNPRAVQLRLPGFDHQALVTVGIKVRDLFAESAAEPARVRERVDDSYVTELAHAVAGGFGDRVGVAPRVFLKKLVGEVLDRVDQFRDFDPHHDYRLTLRPGELSQVERNAAGLVAPSADDVDIDV